MADSPVPAERFAFFAKLFDGIVYVIKTRLPETILSIKVANAMRTHALKNRYHGVFTHAANEGKRSRQNGWILKAMGMVPGAYDWWFVFRTQDGTGPLGAVIIELKVRKGDSQIQPSQVLFGQWCDMSAIPRAVCRSVEEVEAVLREHGAIHG